MSAASDSHGWVLEAVDLYELPLQRYASRMLGDFDLAADAVQHAFLKLCEQSQGALDGRLAPWLFRVCRNRALDHLRHSSRQPAIPPCDQTVFVGASADPARLAERDDLASVVRGLLTDLPPAQREAIDLWCEGLTHKEIADITGRTEGHVRVLVHRGISALRRHPRLQPLLAPRTDRSNNPAEVLP